MSEQQPASSSPPANRLYVGNIPWSTTVEELQALFADATSVEIPTVRFFVFFFVFFCRCFFIPGGSFGGHKARAEKSDGMAIKIESADSFDEKSNDDGIRASNRRRRKHARRHVAGPPSLSLSLSTGDDDDDEKGRHVSSRRRLLYRGNKKGPTVVRAFAFVVVESPKKEKEKSLTFEFRGRALVEASFVIFFSPPYKMSSSSSSSYDYYYCY